MYSWPFNFEDKKETERSVFTFHCVPPSPLGRSFLPPFLPPCRPGLLTGDMIPALWL